MELGTAKTREEEPAAHPRSSYPIDLVHLSRYTLGDRPLEQEALQLFCIQAEVYLDRLREAASAKAWRDTAHSIKGSAKAIGAWRVASAAEAAEHFNVEDIPSERRAYLNALEISVNEAKTYVEAILAAH